MISRLRLVHYKGFNEFALNLNGSSVLVGPNNAGKTTIIGALRLCAYLVRQAHLRNPALPFVDETRDRKIIGYALNLPDGQFVQENVRYEFHDLETRLELRLKNGALLFVVWPVDGDPFFYLEKVEGVLVRDKSVAKQCFGDIGTIPTLSPVEHREFMLSSKHVKDNHTTRLVSRHFRNQLFLLKSTDPSGYSELVEFILANSPEIEDLALVSSMSGSQFELDLYYKESSTHTEKEIYWAGDGLQIWLQILYHIWRQPDVGALILDEPDIFLHPDLQRRLVRVLEDLDGQVILATHAPEILSEWNREAVVIVDRNRKTSRRVTDDKALASLNDALGSGFNLRLAKTLRSRAALFVEGKDMKTLRNIAKAVGAVRFAKEQGLAVVPMEGYTKRGMASAFGWLNESFLNKAVQVFVVLDRDYRSDEISVAVVKEFADVGVNAHVWKKKELESYLIVPTVMARVSGISVDDIETMLDECVEAARTGVLARYLAERNLEERGPNQHQVTINEKYLPVFDSAWKNSAWRRAAVPPKDLISALNQKIQALGKTPLSPRMLSSRIRADEVPDEMKDLILRVEEALTSSR